MGLLDIGYHLIIDREGCVHKLRDVLAVGSHCPGYNHCSIGVCLIGGLDAEGKPANNFTEAQWVSFQWVVGRAIRQWPGLRVRGHKELKGYEGHSVCPPVDMRVVRFMPCETEGKTLTEMLHGKHPPKGAPHG